MKNLFILTFLLVTTSAFACSDILNSTLRVLDSDDEKNLCEYCGNLVLDVNVASRCGYTPQYAALQRIYSKYKDDGFVVIGIPSRDFKQEFSEEAKVAEFCSTEYGVTFPMFATSPVKGKKANSFFKALAEITGQTPGWNFHKYLISKEGEVLSFDTKVEPDSQELTSQISKLL